MRILIVEDDVLTYKVMQLFLEKTGCNYDIASTGKDALKLYNANVYDLILTDIGLPDFDGISLAHKIRTTDKHSKNVPIIAVTAHGTEETKARCFAVGINDFIVKPIDFNKIKNIVSNLTTIN